MTDELALDVTDLHRRYGSGPRTFEAVRGVSLQVPRGSVVALLGTNGAGKTSTMEVIEGLATASSGAVRVFGHDPVRDRAACRRRTGVLLQDSGFSGDLTVQETLDLWASTLTAPMPISEAAGMLELQHRMDTRVLSLSGGERRRLDLACTLLGRPDLVLLDEPTTGLDPESRMRVWELLASLREQGVSILLTTHYLEEAERLADRITIMHAGRIVREGTRSELVAEHPSTVRFASPGVPLPGLPGEVSEDRGTTVIRTRDLQACLTTLLSWAERERITLAGLDARTASLEAVFLETAQAPDDRVAGSAATPTTSPTGRQEALA